MCNYRCKTKLFLFSFYDVSVLCSELRHSTLLDRHGKSKQPFRLIMWRGWWPSGTWRRVVWHVGTCVSDEPPPQSPWHYRRCVLLYTSLHVATLQNTAAFSYCLLKLVQYLTYSSNSYSILHTAASLPLTHPTATGMDSVTCQTCWVRWTADRHSTG
jgi:hypothetical protein